MTLAKQLQKLSLKARLKIENDEIKTAANENIDLQVLNKLKKFNDGDIGLKICDKDMEEIMNLAGNITFQNDNEDNAELNEFLSILSLVVASYKVNQLIQGDITIELVDRIVKTYFNIVEVFRTTKFSQTSKLLSKCSFISPLLITISFSFKLKYDKSDKIIKLLSVVFNYLLNNVNTLMELIKLFSVNSSTNMEVFDVFNKLWLKTLEYPNNLNENFYQGPITVMNRLDLIDKKISFEVIDQILPFNPNRFLLGTSNDIVQLTSSLINLSDNPTSACYEIIKYLATDSGVELVYLLIESLELSNDLFQLYKVDQFTSIIHYIFWKFLNVISIGSYNPFITQILSTDIIEIIEKSNYSRYKVLFEIIDQNYNIDLKMEFQLIFALEHSLLNIYYNFNLNNELLTLTELGSSFSIEAILNYISFILQNGIIELVNSKFEVPSQFKQNMELKKFPPLPRSLFFDFTVDKVSDAQLNLKNFDKLINSLNLSIDLINKVLESEAVNKKQLKLIDEINGKDMNLKFNATKCLLSQYFTVLFSNLILSSELISKASKSPLLFFDYESIGNVLRLKTFKCLESLFKVYGTFAIYELTKFITEISYLNLDLQKQSMVFLNHLIFHTDLGIKETILSNEFIRASLIKFICDWNDGTLIYKNFIVLLNIKTNPITLVQFEISPCLKLLGIEECENEDPVSTPSSSSSNFNPKSYPNTSASQGYNTSQSFITSSSNNNSSDANRTFNHQTYQKFNQNQNQNFFNYNSNLNNFNSMSLKNNSNDNSFNFNFNYNNTTDAINYHNYYQKSQSFAAQQVQQQSISQSSAQKSHNDSNRSLYKN